MYYSSPKKTALFGKSWAVFKCNPCWVATVSSSPWPLRPFWNKVTGAAYITSSSLPSLPRYSVFSPLARHIVGRVSLSVMWKCLRKLGLREWRSDQPFRFHLKKPLIFFNPQSLHHLEVLRDWNAWPFLVMFIQGFKKYVEAILFHDAKNSFCFLSKLPKSSKMYRLFAELCPPEKLNCIFPLNKSVEFNACLSTH